MSIRKYLCRELDRENKGYVTVKDITDKVFSGEFIGMTILIFIVTVCIALIMCLIGELYNNGLTGEEKYTLDYITLNNFVAGFVIFGILIIIILIFGKLWEYIKTFKVIICPLKQKEEKKE